MTVEGESTIHPLFVFISISSIDTSYVSLIVCNSSLYGVHDRCSGWAALLMCTFYFYPRGASDAGVIAIIVCLCVCVCVCLCITRRYCIKMAKLRITQTTSRDIPGTLRLVFWRQNLLVDDPPSPLKFALKVTHFPFKQHNFDQYLLIASQPWELAKEVQLALIGSRPRAFQRAIGEPCTLPLTPPKSGT